VRGVFELRLATAWVEDHGFSGSRVIQYSVSGVGGVVNRAFTT
jgi:hypothetical protein